MGIRFYCPNGHKLNVKDFQAGRNGLCPFCGSKMQIPLESTRTSSRHKSQSQEGGDEASAASEVTVAELDSPTVAETTPPPDQTATPSADTTPSAATSPAEVADPLVEAGEVVWYVRPTSGGQFGPATADCMRTWLAEGRIAVETLVWREGWRDWRDAGDVFPQLSSSASFTGLETILPELAAAPLHTQPAKPRTRDRTTQYLFIGGLTFVVLLLFAILILVLMNP